MAHHPERTSEDPGGSFLIPAPYGRACAGCARAKCKCFYQQEGASCERCQRLSKQCEPAIAVRKRKAQTQFPPPAPPSRLEERLDDIVSLLRSQGVERQGQMSQHTPPSMLSDDGSPSAASVHATYRYPVAPPPTKDPDVTINPTAGVVHMTRPSDTNPKVSPVAEDVAAQKLSPQVAEESLNDFRRSFLPMFPFVHIPAMMTAGELRGTKPFLWLVIMAVSSKSVSRQFAMEDTIWRIISQRIIVEHLADLDLLLGVVCFASWSHYFKKDKPFMTMLSQMAVALAMELNIHKDEAQSKRTMTQSQSHSMMRPKGRTMEERRTMLAVFHLTSSTWTAYRKTEPLRWTAYLETCLRALHEKAETTLDNSLACQIECQIITNTITCIDLSDATEREPGSGTTAALARVLLSRLRSVQEKLPPDILSERAVQLYLSHAELTVREGLIGRNQVNARDSLSHFSRLQDLELLMDCAEKWLGLFTQMPLNDWVGINVDVFAQFTHTLVIVFKLNTLSETGWDLDEYRRRANVLQILDRTCETIDSVPSATGMVDADGPRSGLFFKTTYLLRAIKALFVTEMGPLASAGREKPQSTDGRDGPLDDDSVSILDDFLMNLENEPWISDILGPSWDSQLDSSVGFPFEAPSDTGEA